MCFWCLLMPVWKASAKFWGLSMVRQTGQSPSRQEALVTRFTQVLCASLRVLFWKLKKVVESKTYPWNSFSKSTFRKGIFSELSEIVFKGLGGVKDFHWDNELMPSIPSHQAPVNSSSAWYQLRNLTRLLHVQVASTSSEGLPETENVWGLGFLQEPGLEIQWFATVENRVWVRFDHETPEDRIFAHHMSPKWMASGLAPVKS